MDGRPELSPKTVECIRNELRALQEKDVPPPSPSALATLRSKRLTHDQCLEVFNKYVKWCRHQASPAELRNSSKAFVSMCTLVKKQAPKTAATGFKTSAQASSEMQNLLEELQSQMHLDAFALKCLKAVDCNTAVRVLRILKEQAPGRLHNPSAYVVHLLKKAECDLFPKGSEGPPMPPPIFGRGDVNAVPATGLASRASTQSNPEAADQKPQVPVHKEESPPRKPAPVPKSLPILGKTITGRFSLSHDKQHVKLMQEFNNALMAHDCTVEVMGCSQEKLALFLRQPDIELPAEDLPEYCTRPYGQVLLLLVSDQDGSLHGPWAALPSANSPDQAAVQQVAFRKTAIYIRLPEATTFCILDYEDTSFYLPQSLKLKGKKAFIKALTASKS